MATSYMGGTANAVFVPTVIANQALGYLSAYLNLGATVAKDSDLEAVSYGKIIQVPIRGALTANQKTENNGVTVQKPTATNVSVTMDQHWEVTFGEEDYVRAVEQNDPLSGYIQDAVLVLGEKIESALATLVTSFTNSYGEIAGGADPIGSLQLARIGLVAQKVPKLMTKFAYLHPTFVYKLTKATAFIDPKLIPNNNALHDGAVGRAAGFDIFEGQLVTGSGSPTDYHNILYTRDAMVLASRPLPLPDAGLGVQAGTALSESGLALRVLRSYNPSALAVQITLDTLYGAAILDNRLGASFYSS